MNENRLYRRSAEKTLSVEVIGDETVILSAATATVFVLNAAASRLWDALETGASVHQFTDSLPIDDRRRRAIKTCFQDLLDAELICPTYRAKLNTAAHGFADLETAPRVTRWSRSSEASQVAYFDMALELTQEVAHQCGTQDRFYNIAGVTIKVAFASTALHTLFTPALAHCEIDRADCQIELHVWDGVSARVDLPAPLPAQNFTPGGKVLAMQSVASRIAFEWDSYAVSLAHEDAQTGIYWVADPAGLDRSDTNAPMHILLGWVLQWHDRHVLRGAALADEGRSVLMLFSGNPPVRDTISGLAPMAQGYVVVADQPDLPVSALYRTNGCCADQHPAAVPLGAVMMSEETYAAQQSPEIALDRADHVALKLRQDLAEIPGSGHKAQRFAAQLAHRVSCGVFSDQASLDATASGIRTGTRQRPPVTVILPIYNEVTYLRAALDSIAAQSVEGLEVIIVDDGSCDPLAHLTGPWPFTPRIIRQANTGPSAARNTGLRHAKGAFIAFLDGDDLWPEGRLAAMIDAFDAAPALDVVMGFGQTFAQAQPDADMQPLEDPKLAFPYYLGSALFRRIAFARAGVLDENMKFAEDTDWFNRATEALLLIHHLQTVTLLVRRHETNITAHRSTVELGELRMIKKKHDRLFWSGRHYPHWPRDPWGLGQDRI